MNDKGGLTRSLVAIALATLMLAHVWGWLRIPLLEQIDHAIYDARVRLDAQSEVSSSVVIIDIDDVSMAALGRWPWPRDVIADGISKLFVDYGARAVGTDFSLAESSDRSADKLLEQLRTDPRLGAASIQTAISDIELRWDPEARLEATLDQHNVVLAYVFKDFIGGGDQQESGALPPPLFQAQDIEDLDIPFIEAAGYSGPLARYLGPNVKAGYVSVPSADRDGIIRRAPLTIQYQGDIYESFALALVRAALGNVPTSFEFAADARTRDLQTFTGLRLGQTHIPLDERTNVLIPYRGPMRSFRYISFVDVLDGTAPFEDIFDRVVLIGTTAASLPDVHSTPVGPRYPGVEIHANLVAGLLDGRVKASPMYLRGLETLLLIGIAIVVTVIGLWPLFISIPALLGLLSGLHWATQQAWTIHQLDIPVAAALMLILSCFVLQFLIGFARESRHRNELARVFGQYIPKDIAHGLNRGTASVALEGDSREMSVLFTDVRGFTSIAEGLPPHELTQLMNAFLSPITRAIHHHRGTIDKYMGDAVMAFWGAPLPDPRHASNAVGAALRMIKVLEELRPTFAQKGWPPLQIGVGINTGTMHVGNMGSDFRVAYTVLGDAVNLGSRLEGLTKHYGVGIIVSAATRLQATEFMYRELDAVRVKGKAEPVHIFEPVGLKSSTRGAQLDELALWENALTAYRTQRWEEAAAHLESLQAIKPDDRLYALYQERVAAYTHEPPAANWDGVFEHQHK